MNKTVAFEFNKTRKDSKEDFKEEQDDNDNDEMTVDNEDNDKFFICQLQDCKIDFPSEEM